MIHYILSTGEIRTCFDLNVSLLLLNSIKESSYFHSFLFNRTLFQVPYIMFRQKWKEVSKIVFEFDCFAITLHLYNGSSFNIEFCERFCPA